MRTIGSKLNPLILPVLLLAAVCLPIPAPAAGSMEQMLRDLRDPDRGDWQRVEADILREWSKSGSPSMDLLLERGRDAIESEKMSEAIEHLTALTDHAPDFAEGWNALASVQFRAGAYGPAVEGIARTLTLNPDHWGALAGLGMILEETGDDAGALAAYRAALAVNPHSANIAESASRLDRELSGEAL